MHTNILQEESSYTPNFFGFLKDRFAFFHFPDIEQVRVQFFVIVIYLEECTPVCIHQVFCIYLQNNISDKDLVATLTTWRREKIVENYVTHRSLVGCRQLKPTVWLHIITVYFTAWTRLEWPDNIVTKQQNTKQRCGF